MEVDTLVQEIKLNLKWVAWLHVTALIDCPLFVFKTKSAEACMKGKGWIRQTHGCAPLLNSRDASQLSLMLA
jgi:hypothetical protein